MSTTRFEEDVYIAGNLTVVGNKPELARTDLAQESLADYGIPLTALRKWDDFAAVLPATPLTDDLGIVTGTWGTDYPTVQTEDLKAAGATSSYAGFIFSMPAEYDDATDIVIRLRAGMLTTVSDTTATIDLEVYESDLDGGIGADLCATAATTINSLTLADKDFVITNTGLVSGDAIAVRIHVAVNDGATGTAVKAIIGDIRVRCDIRG